MEQFPQAAQVMVGELHGSLYALPADHIDLDPVVLEMQAVADSSAGVGGTALALPQLPPPPGCQGYWYSDGGGLQGQCHVGDICCSGLGGAQVRACSTLAMLCPQQPRAALG